MIGVEGIQMYLNAKIKLNHDKVCVGFKKDTIKWGRINEIMTRWVSRVCGLCYKITTWMELCDK